MMSSGIARWALIAALAALPGCARSAADTTVASTSPAQAVRDFYYGLEHRNAERFCGSIVVKDGRRFERVGQEGCKSDFHDGAYDGLVGGSKFVRVLKVSRLHRHASVTVRLRTAHGPERASMTVYFEFGHWAVPIPPAR